ncbi:MAG: hypothetical protein ACYCST_18070 [Acidimicrobiales bacterium]
MVKRHRGAWLAGVAMVVAVALLVRFVIVSTGSKSTTPTAAAASSLTSAQSVLSSLSQSLSTGHPPSASDVHQLVGVASSTLSVLNQSASALHPLRADVIASDQASLTPAQRQQEQAAFDAAVPQLKSYSSTLSSIRSGVSALPSPAQQTADTPQADNTVLASYVLTSATSPPTIIDAEQAFSGAYGPAMQLLTEVEQIATEGLLLQVATAGAAARLVVSLINRLEPFIQETIGAVKTLLNALKANADLVLTNVGRVGTPWPNSYCPSQIVPVLCWLLQGYHAELFSSLLNIPLILYGSVSFLLLVSEVLTFGEDTPVTAIADAITLSCSGLQLSLDAIRLYHYSSFGAKVMTLTLDGAGIAMSILDTVEIEAGERIAEGATKAAESTQKLFTDTVDAIGFIDKAGTTTDAYRLLKRVSAADAALEDANWNFKAARVVAAIDGLGALIMAIADSYNGPLHPQIKGTLLFIVKLLDELLRGSPTPTVPVRSTACVPSTLFAVAVAKEHIDVNGPGYGGTGPAPGAFNVDCDSGWAIAAISRPRVGITDGETLFHLVAGRWEEVTSDVFGGMNRCTALADFGVPAAVATAFYANQRILCGAPTTSSPGSLPPVPYDQYGPTAAASPVVTSSATPLALVTYSQTTASGPAVIGTVMSYTNGSWAPITTLTVGSSGVAVSAVPAQVFLTGATDFLVPIPVASVSVAAIVSDVGGGKWHVIPFDVPSGPPQTEQAYYQVVGHKIITGVNNCEPDCAGGTITHTTYTYDSRAGAFTSTLGG